jgi:nitroreductase
MINLIKFLKSYGRLVKALNGFCYDFYRYFKYSSWKGILNDKNSRNYHSVKIYHALEKSLSFKERNKESGWSNAFLLFDVLEYARINNDFGYHDRAGLSTLKTFLESSSDHKNSIILKNKLRGFDFDSIDSHGTMNFSKVDFNKGILLNPENFFLSRYSLREFKNEIVKDDLIERALKLAMKSPSACNRQPWHIYHITDDKIKTEALKLQSGNKGFGEKIPNLAIIAIDQKAFMPGQERYQHWIDGGMFSMSFVYALHSLGIASCCLNWSQTPKVDRKLRARINIQPNHSVMMMLAIGFPDDSNKVCFSSRRPLNEVLTKY